MPTNTQSGLTTGVYENAIQHKHLLENPFPRKQAIVGPVAVNVYAVGLYVDAGAAKAGAVTDEASAAAALKTGSYTKALKIIMARSVDAQKVGCRGERGCGCRGERGCQVRVWSDRKRNSEMC